MKFPIFVSSGHKQWVLVVEWSPLGRTLASGDNDGVINVWESESGRLIRALKGHKAAVRSLSWQPLCCSKYDITERFVMKKDRCNSCYAIFRPDDIRQLLASGSQDHTIRVWNTAFGSTLFCFSGHTGPVTCIRWAGDNLIYSASYDKTIKIWNSEAVSDRAICYACS